jgi:hypothetical protein
MNAVTRDSRSDRAIVLISSTMTGQGRRPLYPVHFSPTMDGVGRTHPESEEPTPYSRLSSAVICRQWSTFLMA